MGRVLLLLLCLHLVTTTPGWDAWYPLYNSDLQNPVDNLQDIPQYRRDDGTFK